MKDQRELTQARRDLISQLLNAHGWTNTLDSLTGYAMKDGEVKSIANDAAALDLLPYLASLQEEISFQRRMEFVSIDGGPPTRKGPPAHANDTETQAPPPEVIALLNTLTGGTPRPQIKRRARPQDKREG